MEWSVRGAYRIFFGLLLYISVHVEGGIGCFKCFSINGSEPGCGDPFHPAMGNFYHEFCKQTMTNRVGDFPARYCTKIKGVNTRTNIELLVRSCDNDNFDNMCGTFIIEDDEYHGCLMSCKTNACNSASSLSATLLFPSSAFFSSFFDSLISFPSGSSWQQPEQQPRRRSLRSLSTPSRLLDWWWWWLERGGSRSAAAAVVIVWFVSSVVHMLLKHW